MSTHYVYRHYGADDRLLYIGCTKDPFARWQGHRSASPWAADVARTVVAGSFERGEAYEIERLAIIAESPLHNIAHKRRSTPECPTVSIKAMRRALGLTLDQVCERMAEYTGKPFSRGALSAIENGHRGASQQVLDALCVAYGLRADEITTDYQPRTREVAA